MIGTAPRWADEYERLRLIRGALHDDALRCMRLGWSAAEWEERAAGDAGVLDAYDQDERQRDREIDVLSRVVWGLR